jgi:hypothetical protein
MKTIYLSAIFLLLSLTFAMLYAVSAKYEKTIETVYEDKDAAGELLENIVSDLQPLKDLDIDYENCSFLIDLQNKYAEYNLCFTDVSSKINKTFFPDLIIEKNKQKLTLFGDEYFTQYGWMNSNQINSNGQKLLQINFPSNKSLYPYKNTLPLINIYNANPNLLTELLAMIGINDKNLIDEFTNEIGKKDFNSFEEIQKLLRVNSTSLVAVLFGTKTTFWKLEYTFNSNMKVVAVICGIPDKNNVKICRYDLIEKNFEVRS